MEHRQYVHIIYGYFGGDVVCRVPLLGNLFGNGHYFEIGYDAAKEIIFIDRSKTNQSFNAKYASINRKEASLKTKEGKIKLHIFFDESIVEIYTADGTVVFTAQVFPGKSETGLEFYSNGSAIQFENIHYWKMKSSWF